MTDSTKKTPAAAAGADQPAANAAATSDTAAKHPAESVLKRIEEGVDGMLHQPLAMAQWVKDMVAEVRKLL